KLIKQNCLRMMRIVNNIIDINRIETGFLKVNSSNINIVSLLENIIYSASEYANLKYINFIFDTDCEDYHLLCDPELIERIMLNLISNAIKFTGSDGTIWINFQSGEEYVTISVRDSGVGIPKDKLNTIFDRFEQVDNSSFVKNYSGSGIGLNLVKEIVQLHGGNITVTSQVNEGSQFTITLPVSDNAIPKIMEDKKVDQDNNVDTINIEMSDIYTGIDAS
ncbi:MAG: HAMP domain-containing histidine kinase, partial [Clostridia bacterium]|nr:HAMP domain-containing histidine kinase [Clostridia bacterium]